MKRELGRVITVYIIHENNLLLGHHKKTGLWLPPGGHVNKGETADDACIREVKQETNLEIRLLSTNTDPVVENIARQLAVPFYSNVHRVLGSNPCCTYHECPAYLAQAQNPEEIRLNFEFYACEWVSLGDLVQERFTTDVRNIGIRSFEALKQIN